MAEDLGKDGIRGKCISAGPIKTLGLAWLGEIWGGTFFLFLGLKVGN